MPTLYRRRFSAPGGGGFRRLLRAPWGRPRRAGRVRRVGPPRPADRRGGRARAPARGTSPRQAASPRRSGRRRSPRPAPRRRRGPALRTPRPARRTAGARGAADFRLGVQNGCRLPGGGPGQDRVIRHARLDQHPRPGLPGPAGTNQAAGADEQRQRLLGGREPRGQRCRSMSRNATAAARRTRCSTASVPISTGSAGASRRRRLDRRRRAARRPHPRPRRGGPPARRAGGSLPTRNAFIRRRPQAGTRRAASRHSAGS